MQGPRCFRVVEDANTGTVSATPLDTALATQTATLPERRGLVCLH